jgi:predicted nuclease of predicted toxin-antitoxin system
VRFLVDTQLPAALARWLWQRDHQAEHVLEIRLAQSKDTLQMSGTVGLPSLIAKP